MTCTHQIQIDALQLLIHAHAHTCVNVHKDTHTRAHINLHVWWRIYTHIYIIHVNTRIRVSAKLHTLHISAISTCLEIFTKQNIKCVLEVMYVILLKVTILSHESLIILDLLHIQVLSITCKKTMYVSQLMVIWQSLNQCYHLATVFSVVNM